jgi:hypothetical protein
MQSEPQVSAIAHVIQLSVAPVFLLSGVAALLAVLTNRVGRIIDRARALEAKAPGVDPTQRAEVHDHLSLLSRRARLINWAISLCTTCALLICAVIVTLFVGAFTAVEVSRPVAGLFICAMLALFLGLLNFLREMFAATRNLRIGPR